MYRQRNLSDFSNGCIIWDIQMNRGTFLPRRQIGNSTAEIKRPADEVRIALINLKAIVIIAAVFGNSPVFKLFTNFQACEQHPVVF